MPFLNIDGISLNYNVKGVGIPIIFIHPPTLTSETFENQVQELSKHFQLVTFDIRGHGKSQYSSKPITYSLIVNDIISLMDHLEIQKAFICGYSTGGSIVLEFLLTFYKRAYGGIVVSGMSEVSDLYLKKKIGFAQKLAKIGAIPILAWGISRSNSNTPKLFQKMFITAKKGNPNNIEEYYRYSLHYNCTNRLREIHHPILLLYGKKDKPFHKYAKLLQNNLPNNELIMIEKVDHRIPAKAAERFNNEIEKFISTHLNQNKNAHY